MAGRVVKALGFLGSALLFGVPYDPARHQRWEFWAALGLVIVILVPLWLTMWLVI